MNMTKKVWREIDALTMFKHPHIINLYEVLETRAEIFVLMEFAVPSHVD